MFTKTSVKFDKEATASLFTLVKPAGALEDPYIHSSDFFQTSLETLSAIFSLTSNNSAFVGDNNLFTTYNQHLLK